MNESRDGESRENGRSGQEEVARHDIGLIPTVVDCRSIHLVPSFIGKSHGGELINIIYICLKGWCQSCTIHGMVDELGTIMDFKATNNASVIRLNVRGKIWLKIDDANVSE